MTHAIGDRGQRWEVSFFNPSTNDRQVYGWTDDQAAALRMADSVEKHPSWAFPQVTDRQAMTGKDRAFLVEMRGRLEKGRNGDATQLDYLAQMIDDWIHELTPNVELTGAAAALLPQRPATEGSEVERRVGGQADASAP